MTALTEEQIFERICRLRKATGLSQSALAMLVGVNSNSISQWERGAAHPRIDNIARVANTLGVSCDVLLTGREHNDTL